MNWREGFPTTSGAYVVFLGKGQRRVVLNWIDGQRDWRDGAKLVRVVRWCGPLPELTA